jgi:hypothetical protein
MMRRSLFLLALVSLAGAATADLSQIRQEKNPEKRADLAIDYADELARSLHKTYEDGDWQKAQAILVEIGDAVEFSYQSLRESGKNARKSPKHFKRGELKTREILRRLETFSNEMSVDDREPADKTRSRVQKVHDDLLADIMGTK